MQDLNIREATINDIETLLQFEQGVIGAERPFDPTLKPHPTSYYDLPGMIEDPDVFLIVAEFSGLLIASGYARRKKAEPFLRHNHYAYLGFMYVRPEFRGRGINSRIIETLKEWAAENGLDEIRLEVYAENDNAIRAYEKAGFEKHMVEMRLHS